MIPNIKHAKKHFNDDAFAPYSTAYVTTNEDLRNALKCMPKDTTDDKVVVMTRYFG